MENHLHSTSTWSTGMDWSASIAGGFKSIIVIDCLLSFRPKKEKPSSICPFHVGNLEGEEIFTVKLKWELACVINRFVDSNVLMLLRCPSIFDPKQAHWWEQDSKLKLRIVLETLKIALCKMSKCWLIVQPIKQIESDCYSNMFDSMTWDIISLANFPAPMSNKCNAFNSRIASSVHVCPPRDTQAFVRHEFASYLSPFADPRGHQSVVQHGHASSLTRRQRMHVLLLKDMPPVRLFHKRFMGFFATSIPIVIRFYEAIQ